MTVGELKQLLAARHDDDANILVYDWEYDRSCVPVILPDCMDQETKKKLDDVFRNGYFLLVINPPSVTG